MNRLRRLFAGALLVPFLCTLGPIPAFALRVGQRAEDQVGLEDLAHKLGHTPAAPVLVPSVAASVATAVPRPAGGLEEVEQFALFLEAIPDAVTDAQRALMQGVLNSNYVNKAKEEHQAGYKALQEGNFGRAIGHFEVARQMWGQLTDDWHGEFAKAQKGSDLKMAFRWGWRHADENFQRADQAWHFARTARAAGAEEVPGEVRQNLQGRRQPALVEYGAGLDGRPRTVGVPGESALAVISGGIQAGVIRWEPYTNRSGHASVRYYITDEAVIHSLERLEQMLVDGEGLKEDDGKQSIEVLTFEKGKPNSLAVWMSPDQASDYILQGRILYDPSFQDPHHSILTRERGAFIGPDTWGGLSVARVPEPIPSSSATPPASMPAQLAPEVPRRSTTPPGLTTVETYWQSSEGLAALMRQLQLQVNPYVNGMKAFDRYEGFGTRGARFTSETLRAVAFFTQSPEGGMITRIEDVDALMKKAGRLAGAIDAYVINWNSRAKYVSNDVTDLRPTPAPHADTDPWHAIWSGLDAAVRFYERTKGDDQRRRVLGEFINNILAAYPDGLPIGKLPELEPFAPTAAGMEERRNGSAIRRPVLASMTAVALGIAGVVAKPIEPPLTAVRTSVTVTESRPQSNAVFSIEPVAPLVQEQRTVTQTIEQPPAAVVQAELVAQQFSRAEALTTYPELQGRIPEQATGVVVTKRFRWLATDEAMQSPNLTRVVNQAHANPEFEEMTVARFTGMQDVQEIGSILFVVGQPPKDLPTHVLVIDLRQAPSFFEVLQQYLPKLHPEGQTGQVLGVAHLNNEQLAWFL